MGVIAILGSLVIWAGALVLCDDLVSEWWEFNKCPEIPSELK